MPVFLLLTNGWLTYMLGLFPHTQVWSEQLVSSLLALSRDILDGVIAAESGLATVLVIFVLTKLFVRMLRVAVERFECGPFEVQGGDPKS